MWRTCWSFVKNYILPFKFFVTSYSSLIGPLLRRTLVRSVHPSAVKMINCRKKIMMNRKSCVQFFLRSGTQHVLCSITVIKAICIRFLKKNGIQNNLVFNMGKAKTAGTSTGSKLFNHLVSLLLKHKINLHGIGRYFGQ